VKRTRLYIKDEAGYYAVLADDILRAKRKADREGLQLSVRLNGTSDLIWENKAFHVLDIPFYNIFEAFPDVIFYDYTKIPLRHRQRAVTTPNYHLTFSYSGGDTSLERANEYLSIGVGVSVVYTGCTVDRVLKMFPNVKTMVDGDVHDMRFLDPRGSIVLLKAKGDAKRDHSGFVVRG